MFFLDKLKDARRIMKPAPSHDSPTLQYVLMQRPYKIPLKNQNQNILPNLKVLFSIQIIRLRFPRRAYYMFHSSHPFWLNHTKNIRFTKTKF